MNIMITGDPHCYAPTYDVRYDTNDSLRKREWSNISAVLLDTVATYKVQLSIFPGDLFNNARPKLDAICMLGDLMTDIGHLGSDVGLINGNHDWSVGTSPLNVVERCAKLVEQTLASDEYGDVLHIKHEDEEIVVALIPWRPKSSCESLQEQLNGICDRLRTDPDITRILVSHYATDISTYANGMSAAVEPHFKIEHLKNSSFHACFLGHIHKPQILCENPVIMHPGTMVRIKSDEGPYDCSIYIYDTKKREVIHSIKLPALDIKVIDLGYITDFQSGEWKAKVDSHDVTGAIVNIKYFTTPEHVSCVLHEEIAEYVMFKNAQIVGNISCKVDTPVRKRSESMTPALGFEKAFDIWFDVTEQSQDLKADASEVLMNAIRSIES